jgi:LuxR family maltose regulon positive regulatory protein
MREDESHVRALHGRASRWYEDHGHLRDAVDHAVFAGDEMRVATLVEQAIDEVFMQSGESRLMLRWIDAIPLDLTTRFPRLALAYAWALYYAGRVGEIDPLLARIEAQRGGEGHDEILAELYQVRGLLACARGDLDGSYDLYRQSAEIAPRSDATGRAMAQQGMALALLYRGNTDEAAQALSTAVELLHAAGEHGIVPVSLAYLGFARAEQGRLREAARVFRDGLERAEARGLARAPIVGLLHAGLADLECEWGNQDRALEHVQKSEELSSGQNPLQVWHTRLVLSLVRALMNQGGINRSELDAAPITAPELRGLRGSARAVQTCAALIRSAAAPQWDAAAQVREWLSSIDLQTLADSPGDAVMIGRGPEFARIVAARALAHSGDPDAGLALAAVAAESARGAGRTRVRIEALLATVEALERSGAREQSIAAVREAVELAEPEAYVQVFACGGPDVARVLYALATTDASSEYLTRLITAIPATVKDEAAKGDTARANEDLFEPLSERELDVLRLVAEGLSNSEIGERLYISPQTVKTHIRNLYAKLDTHTRTEAVHKARALGLLPLR